MDSRRPNILYLHSHDTGRYVQPYGHAVPTPHIQRLAEEGVLFRQAFCAAPTCSPSRAALLTGQYPHNSGMLGLAHRGFAVNDYGQHLIHTLRRAGYSSALAGMQHIAKDAATIGYDRIVEHRSQAELVGPAVVSFLREPPPEPFFLSAGFFETHRAFFAPGPAEDARYCLPPRTLPDTPGVRRDFAAFKASARELDRGLGMVLDALEASGLAADTLVICTTDHGLAFPGMKCTLTDQGIGVMLIMRGPGGFDGGKVCDAMVSQIDLYPTICELVGIDRPPWLQGVSMLPLVRGAAERIRDEVVAEVTYHAAYEPQRGVRTERWKYIRRFGDRRRPVLANCDDSPSKDVWLAHGWQEREVAPEQLYDLVFDPGEASNLAAAPEYAAARDEMRGRLERWMRETHDPLLAGPVAAPPGAYVDDQDALSPA